MRPRSPTRTRSGASTGKRHRLDHALHQGQEHLLRLRQRLDQVVRGRHAERLGQLRRPPPGDPRRPDRDHLGARRSRDAGRSTSPTASCTTRSRSSANVLKALGVKKGDRVVLYLPMIPEAAYAMLACARIGAIHSIVFAGFSPDALREPDQRLRREAGDHRRRGAARRQATRRSRPTPTRRSLHCPTTCASSWCGAPAATSPGTPGRDVWLHEEMAEVSSDCAPSRDGRRGPAVHPLHLRLDRQAEGRGAHHRRLPRLRRDDPPATSSTTTTATSSGAPRTSAGSPATATSSTARWRTARPR